jgi:AcrR family transcriptional regulator
MKSKTTQTDKKNIILKAALELFSYNGFEGARIETVAKKVGLSYGAVYYHYPSKEVLFHMVVQYAQEQAMAIYYNAENLPSGSAYERLENYTHLFFQWIDTDEGAQSLMLLSNVLTSKNIPDITSIYVKEKFQFIYNYVYQLMEDIKQEGHAQNKTPDTLSSQFCSMMIGSAFLRISKLGPSLDVDTFLSFAE